MHLQGHRGENAVHVSVDDIANHLAHPLFDHWFEMRDKEC
jgi:hypothetical protein